MHNQQLEVTAIESASQTVAQSIAALLRLRLDTGESLIAKKNCRTVASSFELSQLVSDFLKIRDPEKRRYCLAILRSSSKVEK